MRKAKIEMECPPKPLMGLSWGPLAPFKGPSWVLPGPLLGPSGALRDLSGAPQNLLKPVLGLSGGFLALLAALGFGPLRCAALVVLRRCLPGGLVVHWPGARFVWFFFS